MFDKISAFITDTLIEGKVIKSEEKICISSAALTSRQNCKAILQAISGGLYPH